MKKFITAILQNKKAGVTAVVVLFAVLLVLYLELRPKEYYLTITTQPASATISINNEYAGVGSVQKRLRAGTYTVSALLDGYQPIERKVSLTNTTTLTLPLTQKEETTELPSIKKATLTSGVVSKQGLIIGINRFDSLLYQFDKQSAQALHDKPVAVFSYQHPNVIFLEKQNTRDIVTLNLETQEKRRVSLRALEPVVSVGFIPNSNSVYFLGKLDVDARTTTLFIADTSFLSPKEIATTKATRVVGLALNQALLFEQADAEDASRLVITDTQVGAELTRLASNRYVVSPNNALVLSMDSQQLALYNTSTKQVIRTQNIDAPFIPFFSSQNIPMRIWKSPNGITLETLDEQTLAVTSSQIVAELGSLGVSSVVGMKDDLLILIDSTNKVWQIALP